MGKNSFLQISASILSLVVIGQSIIISRNIQSINQKKDPEILVEELLEPEIEAKQTASIWLEHRQNNNLHELTLWMDNPSSSKSLRAILHYNPQEIELVDQDLNQDGVQIALGEIGNLMEYGVATNSGQISLLTQFEPNIIGKKLIATISAMKKTDNLSRIEIEYLPYSREGSYVSGEEGINILKKPGIISF